MGKQIGLQLQLFQHLFIPFENLHRVPALLLSGHMVYGSLLDMGQRMLHHAGKGVSRQSFG